MQFNCLKFSFLSQKIMKGKFKLIPQKKLRRKIIFFKGTEAWHMQLGNVALELT